MSDYCQDCVHNEVCRYDAYCPTGHCNDKDTVDDLRPQGDVAYLCDGNNCPEEKASCKHGGPCRHTTNIEHAINFRRFHDTDKFFEVENVIRIEESENQ